LPQKCSGHSEYFRCDTIVIKFLVKMKIIITVSIFSDSINDASIPEHNFLTL